MEWKSGGNVRLAHRANCVAALVGFKHSIDPWSFPSLFTINNIVLISMNHRRIEFGIDATLCSEVLSDKPSLSAVDAGLGSWSSSEVVKDHRA